MCIMTHAVFTEVAEFSTGSGVTESESIPDTRTPAKSDWCFVVQAVNTTSSLSETDSNAPGTGRLPEISKVTAVRKISSPVTLGKDRKVLRQQWECVVIDQSQDVVRCEMHDLTNEGNPAEYAEIFLDQFNTYDVPHLVEGAVFYWSIGYTQAANGRIQNVSEFILRRVPRLSRSKRREIASKVAGIRGLFIDK